MIKFEQVKRQLQSEPRVWLITGVAGFIGSNLLEALLKLNQTVVGLDDFSTGFQFNLNEVEKSVSSEQWSNFSFIRGDIRDLRVCQRAVKGVDFVLHQAALGSVPRSISDPIATNEVNVSGFLNMLIASKEEKVKSFTYAASSSTYGDHPALPKVECNIGNPLSPYAVSKYVNELYADVFFKNYDFKSIGLRYFNVFGYRQNPDGAYAAVIPKWISAIINNEDIYINGDGSTSRDFCFVENVIQANILAATNESTLSNEVFNIAVGMRTSLNELYSLIKKHLDVQGVSCNRKAIYREFRNGDVMHSLADVSKARNELGYNPKINVDDGLCSSIAWYIKCLSKKVN